MATVDSQRTEQQAIAELEQTLARQRAAFQREPHPTLGERQQLLGEVAAMLLGHRTAIQQALSEDFAVHPVLAADLIETLGPAGRAAYAAEQLPQWMADEPRPLNPELWGTAAAYVRPQPKGVIGNIVPWNFPFDLSVGPLVEMLAAGNRVVIKPSEYTPACGSLLAAMIGETFDPDRVAVVLGGSQLAEAFSRQRWDHLLYTGNPTVGRHVATAAAENLVPVTLELGGKCPALVSGEAVEPETVRQILATKAIKNGQMCISVDYCLVPREQLADFVAHAETYASEQLGDYADSEDCTGIISRRHQARIEEMLGEARGRGCEIVQLGPAPRSSDSRQLPISLVVDPPADLALMREEIFGPILPLVGYDTLDQAIGHVNEGERPLALYVFSHDDTRVEEILTRTVSGGACVNCAAAHGAQPSLPFGGIGNSGSGRHHGIEGFREFSNLRAVFERGERDMLDAFAPPYGLAAEALVDAALGGG